MAENAKKSVQARCGEIGIFVRLIFWLYVIYLGVLLAAGLYMLTQESGTFSLQLTQTPDGLMGIGCFSDKFEIYFAHCIFDENAPTHAKQIYLIAFFADWVCKAMYAWILYEVRMIFRRIAREETPFVSQNSKALFRIGLLVPISSICKGLYPVVLMLLGFCVGSTGNGIVSWDQLLIGCIIVSLSYVFEYGTILQTESDETV